MSYMTYGPPYLNGIGILWSPTWVYGPPNVLYDSYGPPYLMWIGILWPPLPYMEQVL